MEENYGHYQVFNGPGLLSIYTYVLAVPVHLSGVVYEQFVSLLFQSKVCFYS